MVRASGRCCQGIARAILKVRATYVGAFPGGARRMPSQGRRPKTRGVNSPRSAGGAQKVATTAPWYLSMMNFLASGERSAATSARIAGEFTLSGLAATRFA